MDFLLSVQLHFTINQKNIFSTSCLNQAYCFTYSKEIYHSSEIIGKERKPGLSCHFDFALCQQVARPVPSFYCSVWMLNNCIACS